MNQSNIVSFMKIYVQKTANEFISESAFSVFYGFKSLGYTVIPFEENAPLPREKENIVYGKIGVVLNSLEQIGITPPQALTIPEELYEFLGRSIGETTIKAVRKIENFPVFIKPKYINKLFNGYVIFNKEDLSYIKDYEEDTIIFTSDVVQFVSEYRCFVLNGELVGCKHYKGNFICTPDFNIIKAAIKKVANAVIAYSIDFGITNNNETLLIEINDTYSLSSYGLESKLFCELIKQRWNEIVRSGMPN